VALTAEDQFNLSGDSLSSLKGDIRQIVADTDRKFQELRNVNDTEA
jgi:hypothetical protein